MILRYAPVLVRPKLFALKNNLRKITTSRSLFFREAILGLMSLLVIASMYVGTIAALNDLQQSTAQLFVPPQLPLELFMHLLFFLLFFSNLITALGALYLSTDLDLILASPLSRNRFFIGKISEIVLSSSWMLIVFGIPIFVAFGRFYSAPLAYYGVGAAALVPVFLIPPLIATFLITVFAAMIPANRTREVLVIGLAFVFIGFIWNGGPTQIKTEATSQETLFALLGTAKRFNAGWLPGNWTASVLGEFLSPLGRPIGLLMALLWTTTVTIGALARLSLDLLHSAAYSRARSIPHGMNFQSKRAQRILRGMMPFLGRPFRTLFAKEFKIFARDMSQALQLLLLIGLCSVYLYNFKVLRTVTLPNPNLRPWIQGFLIICNTGLGSFLVTTVCTRFVFPSVSMEGKALWILLSSPVPLSHILRAKFVSWFIPVAIISSTVMTAGALAIDAEPHIVAIHAVSSAVICYGIVGLAIGLGALFAQFEWEFSSQLATSFGSLVFLIASSILIVLNLIPVTMLIFIRTLRNFGYPIEPMHWYIFVGGSALFIAMVNVGAARWALRLGEAALERQIE